MSQQTKTQLQNSINTDIADNSTGAISAGDIRGNMISITDSLLFLTGSATQTVVGDINILGTITGSFTGSLQGIAATASYVTTAQTASYVTTAQTASYVTTAQTASYVTTAQTASYVTTAQTASYVTTAQTASYVSPTFISASAAESGFGGGGSTNYTEYTVLLTYQSPGTFFVSQLENTLGDGSNTSPADIQWSNVANGTIWATKTGAFSAGNKIWWSWNPFIATNNQYYIVTGKRINNNIFGFYITRLDGDMSGTPFFTNIPLTIKIYS